MMKFPILIKSVSALLAALQISVTGLYGEILHLEQPNHAEHLPHLVTKYRLIDIIDTQLDASLMTNLPSKLTHAPIINQRGQVIGNTLEGGFVILPKKWEYRPQINNVMIHVYGIDTKGDLLLTLNRGSDSQEWMLWPLSQGGYGVVRNHIQTNDPFQPNVTFTGYNDNGTFIGYKKIEGRNRPYVWTQAKGFHALGVEKGLQLSGIAKDINQKGSIAGIAEDPTDKAPFLWHEQTGLETLRKYRDALVPKGWVEFSDIILTEDDTIYGTFWIRDHSTENEKSGDHQYYAYRWNPNNAKVQMVDLRGMRLAAVNSHHLLVGSLNGKAMVREPDKLPIALSELMDPQTLQGWELLEATSVNDQGQIVGYGKYNGKVHVFLAEPTS
jgi:hypothetical protein